MDNAGSQCERVKSSWLTNDLSHVELAGNQRLNLNSKVAYKRSLQLAAETHFVGKTSPKDN